MKSIEYMKRIKRVSFLLAMACILAACNVNDPIYDTPHPDHGMITLTADWSDISTGIAKPVNYNISIAGYSCTLSGDCNTIDKLFNPGTYTGLAWNTAENIAVSGSTASVTVSITNDQRPSPLVHNAPGWLFTACDNNVVIEKDKHHQYTAMMQQQVRELTLVIEPTGGIANTISGISGYLSGVAGTLDINNGTHATPSNVQLTFVKGNDGKYRAMVRLLGVTGSEQKLTATLSFTGGRPADQTIDSNLTTMLVNFNADKKTPLILESRAETTSEAEFAATITGWKVIGDSSGIAW